MSKEINIDETLVVLASDIKKLVKHFRLDRRKQGDEETPSETDSLQENEMIQQIAVTVKELSERSMLSTEQVTRIIGGAGEYLFQKQSGHISELKPVIEAIKEKLDELPAEPQQSTVQHDHTYTVDFRNSKAVITIISLVAAFLISLGVNINQANRNSSLRDNDLKYRYVKMRGKTSAEELYRLESVFEYDRNTDSIKSIRSQVEVFERLLKEYNEKQYRIQQDEARAREIEQEAATVKGK